MTTSKIGTTVTKFLKLKQKISAQNKIVTDLKSEAAKMEIDIIKQLEKEKQQGTTVTLGSVKISETLHGNVKDKNKLLKYATTKDAMQLMSIQLSQAAYREMVEDGKKFSFIEPFHKKKLSVGIKRS
ncbi:MAG TPA: hypothetical protein ENJ28_01215 [Gammaproteobacteria bacterium]|nr:hypothetical protein [Gammaproteobacteria bacterium]